MRRSSNLNNANPVFRSDKKQRKSTIQLTIFEGAGLMFFLTLIAGLHNSYSESAESPFLTSGIFSFFRISHRQPISPVTIAYVIDTEHKKERGMPGGECRSGDRIDLIISVTSDCWLTVFCIDSLMEPIPVFPPFTRAPESVPVSGGKMYTIPVILDETTGLEMYYVVAAGEKFTFDMLDDALDKLFLRLTGIHPEGTPKGHLTLACELNLPSEFASDFIFFRHCPSNKK